MSILSIKEKKGIESIIRTAVLRGVRDYEAYDNMDRVVNEAVEGVIKVLKEGR